MLQIFGFDVLFVLCTSSGANLEEKVGPPSQCFWSAGPVTRQISKMTPRASKTTNLKADIRLESVNITLSM
jgi:hypothetical protein